MEKITKEPKIKILLLITQMERAGAQKVIITLADFLHRQNYDVTLCFLYDKGNNIPELQRKHPFKIINLQAKEANSPSYLNIFYTLRAIFRIYAQLIKSKADVILTFTHYSNILGIPIAFLARTTIRLSSQRSTLDGFPRWFLNLDSWIANSPLLDKMIAVSEHTRQFCIEVEGISPDKLITIPNGINIHEFDHLPLSQAEKITLKEQFNISPQSKVLITVARLHPQKGHQYLIEAATQILQYAPDVAFVLVGEGELREEIEKSLEEKKLSPYFRLLGSRKDVPGLLGMADIFILPSVSEGMPNVILEAMAAKLPIIATRVDGTIEVVEDGKTGILVERRNPEALMTAIIKLLQEPTLGQLMGNAGFQRVQQYFSEEIMCQRYDELIHDIFEKKHIINEEL